MSTKTCDFLEHGRECPHSAICGATFPDDFGHKDHFPWWVVFSLQTHPKPLIVQQQLSMFDEPKKLWLLYGKHPKAKRQWDVRTFYCPAGARWGAGLEVELGAYAVKTVKISIAPGYKRKRIKKTVYTTEVIP